MDSDASSRKRFRGASERDELPPWECDPTYGIIHPSGCSICRPYMSHIADERTAHSSSLERAFKDQEHQLDSYFFDGVSEGRRRQRADDQDHFRNLERSRDDAVRVRAETSQHLSFVQNQLRIAQAECEAFRKRLESLTKEKVDRDGLEVESMLLDSPESEDSPAHLPPIPSTYSSSKPEVSSGGISPVEALVPKGTLPPRPTVEVIASSGTLDLPTSPAFPSIQQGRAPKTLRQLQYLMNRAHQPGNDDCLAKVKMLCAEAHQTPREEKTELQRYILHNWRNPETSGSSSISVTPPPPPLLLPNQALLSPKANNPRMEDPVEVWHAYLTTHRGSWPRGVRRASNGSPHIGDLKASRTVARLRPVIGEKGDTSARNEFMACAAQLFASPGMYQDLLRRNALAVVPVVSYKPYRATQFSITAVEVARHFAASGVSVQEAVEELEPWAQEYQAAVVFPTGSVEPRYSKSHANHTSTKSVSGYRARVREHDREDRFGWR
ncbi:hypothetical protein C8R43DRAFT_958967 [Mycena crocata]|nr:hypothetical protein C8R43DRAFT_958967 [Mycena crocata]